MARLKYSQRKRLPTSDFALPSQRKYPLDTANRARNALARASQFASPDEQSEIRAAVKRKFPGIGGKKRKKNSFKRVVPSNTPPKVAGPSAMGRTLVPRMTTPARKKSFTETFL